MKTVIFIAIVLFGSAIIIGLFWIVRVSRRLSIMVFSFIFVCIAVAEISWQGFTQQAVDSIVAAAFILTIGWLRISKSVADTAWARGQLKDRLSRGKYAACSKCGSQKLTYHRMPKNVRQLILGGLTCENCGAEVNIPLDIVFSR